MWPAGFRSHLPVEAGGGCSAGHCIYALFVQAQAYFWIGNMSLVGFLCHSSFMSAVSYECDLCRLKNPMHIRHVLLRRYISCYL